MTFYPMVLPDPAEPFFSCFVPTPTHVKNFYILSYSHHEKKSDIMQSSGDGTHPSRKEGILATNPKTYERILLQSQQEIGP